MEKATDPPSIRPIPPSSHTGRWMTTVALPASLPGLRMTCTFSETRTPGCVNPNVVTNSRVAPGPLVATTATANDEIGSLLLQSAAAHDVTAETFYLTRGLFVRGSSSTDRSAPISRFVLSVAFCNSSLVFGFGAPGPVVGRSLPRWLLADKFL